MLEARVLPYGPETDKQENLEEALSWLPQQLQKGDLPANVLFGILQREKIDIIAYEILGDFSICRSRVLYLVSISIGSFSG